MELTVTIDQNDMKEMREKSRPGKTAVQVPLQPQPQTSGSNNCVSQEFGRAPCWRRRSFAGQPCAWTSRPSRAPLQHFRSIGHYYEVPICGQYEISAPGVGLIVGMGTVRGLFVAVLRFREHGLR